MSKTAGKIIGGFLAGAGIITYLLHSDAGSELKDKLLSNSKDLMHNAEDKLDEVKEGTNTVMDQILNFAIDNKKTIQDTVGYVINTFLKKN